jgi:catechol 2,3-dioxygenase-like lactoylglutathione lyase family enzyme
MTLGSAIPALPVSDASRAAEFYRDRLGFTVSHQESGFAVLRRDDAVLHLWQADDRSWQERDSLERPVRSGAESFLAGTASCRIAMPAADEAPLFAEMRAAGVLHPTSADVAQTDFGTREFHVLDLDGNLLTFYRWL